MARGRPRKPLELHLISGTFRAHRHRDLIETTDSGELGPCPPRLKGKRAGELWEHLRRIGFWLMEIDRYKAAMWVDLQLMFERATADRPMKGSLIAQLRYLGRDLCLDFRSRERMGLKN